MILLSLDQSIIVQVAPELYLAVSTPIKRFQYHLITYLWLLLLLMPLLCSRNSSLAIKVVTCVSQKG
jgi:hypothetical protein